MRIRSVRAPIWEDDADHLIVVGLLTVLNCAMGKDDAAFPMLKVTGPQELMRVSELQEKDSAGVPSTEPPKHTDVSFESCRRSGSQRGSRQPCLPSHGSPGHAGLCT